MLDRIKNPIFIAAAVSFLYNVTNYITTTFFHLTIDPTAWLTFFQLILWLILGVGIYANYTPTPTTQTQPIQYDPPISDKETVIANPTPMTETTSSPNPTIDIPAPASSTPV